MIFRRAEIEDVVRLIELRKLQLQDEGQTPDVDIDQKLDIFFKQKMQSGELVEWVAEDETGRIIATAAVLFIEFPPVFTNPTGKKGYITNMYTADEYRGQGIAGLLLMKIERESKERGITNLMLHASEMGRKAYVKSGFRERQVVMEKKIEIT